MSGGHFDYDQYRITRIADDIKDVIERNGSDEINDFGDRLSRDYAPEVIAQFKQAVRLLNEAYVYAQRIDWLISGDDGEESFRARLKADLEALKEKGNDCAEVDDTDAGSLRAAYKVLTNEHQHLVACYESLIRQTMPLEPVPGDPRWSKRIELDDVLGRVTELESLLDECSDRLDDAGLRYSPAAVRARKALAKHGGDA